MDTLYPNLYERFKSEGLCPICLIEMDLSPRYSCTNGHTVCHRCKPYYYACPTCQSPLELEIPRIPSHPSYKPPPTHFMPQPYPPEFHEHNPSAPSVEDFLNHERQWKPPAPSEDQELIPCLYAYSGCLVKVPEHLVKLHTSRCQFRPHLEQEQLPTDVAHKHEELVECKYQIVGCNVKTSPWRISIHESHCTYKDRYDTINHLSETFDEISVTDEDHGHPDELVDCRYRRYGCMVKTRRSIKLMHEQKCNYSKYCESEEDFPLEEEYDPEEQVACKWITHGCKVRPKRYYKELHEMKCNHRMDES